jgi:TPR repeat protein
VKGCNEGDLAACNSAGYAYLYGEGAPQDDAKGAAFYEKTCGARNAEGCAFFGWVLEKGLGGYDQNETKAAATYEKGCLDGKGNSFACTLLGVLHTEGRGVKKNLAKAAQLYRSGCELGDGEGCLRLGWAYQQGAGVTQSTTLAQELFEKGCNLDNDEACTELDD